MKRHTFLNALCCAVLAVGSEASALDANPQKSEKVGQASGSDAVTTPVADADEVAKQAAEMRELLSQPPEKLNELARERAFKALAALGPGRKLAKWSAREKNIKSKRLEWLTRVERANTEGEELRTELDSEMDKIRQQFADDEAECNRQFLIVIEVYKPRLKELKQEATRGQAEIEKTDEQLAAVRRNVVGLDREVRLAERGLPFRTRTSPGTDDKETVAKLLRQIGVELDLDKLDIKLDGDLAKFAATDQADEFGSGPSDGQQNQNVEQAMAELENLFK